MKCIFCQSSSEQSKSVEHIIPESLGNKIFILERGIVCDSCNNYFARKIEGPLLDMPFFRQTRHRLNVENKKGRIPPDKGIVIDAGIGEIIITKDRKAGSTVIIPDKSIEKKILKRKEIPVYVPEFGLFDTRSDVISRFLVKVGIEGIAFDMVHANVPFETSVNLPFFDTIKRYCRYPKTNEFWPYTVRQVQFVISGESSPEDDHLKSLIFFYSFLSIPDAFFLQLYISGFELTIDMANASCEHILRWFTLNPDRCFVLDAAIKQWEKDKTRV